MRIYLIRHSEPDYEPVTEAGYVGYGRDLAGLSEKGITIAKQAAQNSLFEKVELLLSSPYTRALQTALEISKKQNLEVKVELGLHEWRPDKTGRVLSSPQQVKEAFEYYEKYQGMLTPDAPFAYESSTEMRHRAKKFLTSIKINTAVLLV